MPAAPVQTQAPVVELCDRAAAEAYVASVCFKHGPPRLLGVELEWIVRHRDDPLRALHAGHLADALGAHAPPELRPESPNLPLPAGSTVTVEPGGQVEISTPPRDSLAELVATADRDRAALTALLESAGLCLASVAIDSPRPPRRLLRTPRYEAQHAAYQREGPSGYRMMCSTAATQVCLDTGTAEQAGPRWRALYALGPVLVAAFANSPGPAAACERMLLWSRIGRGAHPPTAAEDYPRFAVDAPLMCVRRDGGGWLLPPAGASFADWVAGALPGVVEAPTTSDLDYHLTTLFPPVRPRGHLEVRYLDAQPPDRWALPVAVLAALLATDEGCARATELALPVADRWVAAARCGLADPPLAAAAGAVLRLARALLPRLDPPPQLQRELDRFLPAGVIRR